MAPAGSTLQPQLCLLHGHRQPLQSDFRGALWDPGGLGLCSQPALCSVKASNSPAWPFLKAKGLGKKSFMLSLALWTEAACSPAGPNNPELSPATRWLPAPVPVPYPHPQGPHESLCSELSCSVVPGDLKTYKTLCSKRNQCSLLNGNLEFS